MAKNLTSDQILSLLTDDLSDQSKTEEICQQQLSDISDFEVGPSDHDTESEE